jgi:hypothetical protein
MGIPPLYNVLAAILPLFSSGTIKDLFDSPVLASARPGEYLLKLMNAQSDAPRESLRLRFTDGDAERVRELSAKSNTGRLTTAEERELENYFNVGRMLEFLKAKARPSLHDGERSA